MNIVITNARIVTADESFMGSVSIANGMITAVDTQAAATATIDFEGDFLLPGVVDIHTDNLERHYFPRPNIDWNAVSAAIAHDGVCLSAGITTVFDSLSIGAWGNAAARELDNLRGLVDGVEHADAHGALRAQHLFHWRCELTADNLPALVEEFMPRRLTGLASIMDHTPGQRQYRHLDFFLDRVWRSEGVSEAEIAARINDRREKQARNVVPNRASVAAAVRHRQVALATHDDETIEHIEQGFAVGATIAEFPVTAEAAAHARARGMVNVMGGPNLIRGGSYSGNVSAAETANLGLLDGFASDYVPRSLIECAFRLAEPPFGWSLPDAVRTVTQTPARAVGLDDRGAVAPGKRADILRVRLNAGLPVVRGVWVKGERVG
ncbi:MAG: alpha-D-ribose 1-methylphosphonate 5-triphosphate diphosphatase [Sandarakinorhabdus sp.]